MINETKKIKENANIVKTYGVPQVPMLLFISNGSGGTGFDEKTWRSIPKEYISKSDNAIYMELDCPHYVHDTPYYLDEDFSSSHDIKKKLFAGSIYTRVSFAYYRKWIEVKK